MSELLELVRSVFALAMAWSLMLVCAMVAVLWPYTSYLHHKEYGRGVISRAESRKLSETHAPYRWLQTVFGALMATILGSGFVLLMIAIVNQRNAL